MEGFEYVKDVAYHAFLPVTAIILGVALGGIMGMRANDKPVREDYIVMGTAKGFQIKRLCLSTVQEMQCYQ